jgi:hypothetical protein
MGIVRDLAEIPAGRRWYGERQVTKTELHQLVDELPDESLEAAAVLLKRARDPVIARLDAAPYDDEDLTEEDHEAVRQALREPGVQWSDTEPELRTD